MLARDIPTHTRGAARCGAPTYCFVMRDKLSSQVTLSSRRSPGGPSIGRCTRTHRRRDVTAVCWIHEERQYGTRKSDKRVQEAQLSQRGRTMIRVTEYFAKSLNLTEWVRFPVSISKHYGHIFSRFDTIHKRDRHVAIQPIRYRTTA